MHRRPRFIRKRNASQKHHQHFFLSIRLKPKCQCIMPVFIPRGSRTRAARDGGIQDTIQAKTSGICSRLWGSRNGGKVYASRDTTGCRCRAPRGELLPRQGSIRIDVRQCRGSERRAGGRSWCNCWGIPCRRRALPCYRRGRCRSIAESGPWFLGGSRQRVCCSREYHWDRVLALKAAFACEKKGSGFVRDDYSVEATACARIWSRRNAKLVSLAISATEWCELRAQDMWKQSEMKSNGDWLTTEE